MLLVYFLRKPRQFLILIFDFQVKMGARPRCTERIWYIAFAPANSTRTTTVRTRAPTRSSSNWTRSACVDYVDCVSSLLSAHEGSRAHHHSIYSIFSIVVLIFNLGGGKSGAQACKYPLMSTHCPSSNTIARRFWARTDRRDPTECLPSSSENPERS